MAGCSGGGGGLGWVDIPKVCGVVFAMSRVGKGKSR